MSSSCNTCKKKITATKLPGLQCCGPCKNWFHAACVGLSSATLHSLNDDGIFWTCVNCRSAPGSPNKSIIIVDSAENLDETSTLSSILAYVKSTDAKLKDYQSFVDSVKFCSEKISDFEAIIKTMESKMKDYNDLKIKNDATVKELTDLKYRLNDLEQRSRYHNIEIVGIPEQKQENLLKLVVEIGQQINYPITQEDIDVVHRVTKTNSTKPKNIIVKFTSRYKRDNFCAAARKNKNNLTSGSLKFSTNNKIFVNDHLSPFYKILLTKTKELAKEHHYRFVWVPNFKIFLRKHDSAPFLIINNDRDLSKIK